MISDLSMLSIINFKRAKLFLLTMHFMMLSGVIAIIVATATSYAVDIGVVGQTFNIAEESFIAMLKKRLDKVDIAAEQKKMQEQAKYRVENPVAVSGITKATKDRIFYFDPTYVLEKDAILPCGKILHKAGTKVNPLEHMGLDRRLFFIDGRSQDQIIWLKERLKEHSNRGLTADNAFIEDRVILIGGSVFELKKDLKETFGEEAADKVYFDQSGELTTKFGISASPAIVVQEGFKLKIVELNLIN